MIRCARLANILNHTWDESANIASAVGLYETGRIIFMVEHPPLERWVIGLPLFASGIRLPEWHGTDVIQQRGISTDTGLRILFHSPIPYWAVLTRARYASICVFLPVLFFFLFCLVARLSSEVAAAAAVAFLSVDPTLLAQGPLATTDIASAATFMMAAYFGVRYIARPSLASFIKVSVAVGIACSAKLNVAFVVPGLVLLVAVRFAMRNALSKWDWNILRAKGIRFAKRSFLAAIVSFVSLWATYGFCISPLGHQTVFLRPAWYRVPELIRNMHVPMPSLLWSGAYLFGMEKPGAWINGAHHNGGVWYYFIEAIALKSAIAFVGSLILAFAFCLQKGAPRLRALALLLPPSVFFLAASLGSLQLGIRHMVLVIPFLCGFVALMFVRKGLTLPLTILIAIAAVETGAAWPDYIPYFNAAAGGAVAGDRYFGDGNLDLGQSVAELATYAQTLPREAPLYALIENPGTVELAAQLHLKLATVPTIGGKLGWNNVLIPSHGFLAVARLIGPAEFGWLPKSAVVATVGGSIDVYDLDRPEVQAAARAKHRDARATDLIKGIAE